jgi:hypothetical protein
VKQTRLRSLRGSVEINNFGQGRRQLIVDDGLINVGYKILSWTIWPTVNFSADRWGAILSTKPEVFPLKMSATNNNQIGWNYAFDLNDASPPVSILDPDHIAVRDLYITMDVGGAGAGEEMNYLIVMQQYDLTDDEAIIQISKEENQASSPA